MTVDLARRQFLIGAAVSVLGAAVPGVAALPVYGRSPGADALGDVYALQRAAAVLLRRITNPPWLVHEDGRVEPLDNDEAYLMLELVLQQLESK